jgi:hypothetical protein
MKLKKEYVILGLIIIGLSVYLLTRTENRTLYQLPELPNVDPKDITRLEITKGDIRIVLNRTDNEWQIAPRAYPADAAKVKDILDSGTHLTLTALVSESANYDRYDLSESTKINLKAWQGDSLRRDIDVGKTAPSFRHTFVKLAGDDRVFHASGNFRPKIDQPAEMLREKTVLVLAPADIREIEVSKDQQTLVFTRTEIPAAEKTTEAGTQADASGPVPKRAWQTADGRQGDDNAFFPLLNALATLRCEKFIDDRKKEEFTAPLYSLKLKNGQAYELSIFAKPAEEDQHYPATSSGSEYPFLLSGTQVDRIMRAPQEFLEKPESAEENTPAGQPDSTTPQD